MPAARVLLGWMEREPAIHALRTACEGGLTEEAAEAIWRPYRDRVEALPDRVRELPAEQVLSAEDRHHIKKFLKRARPVDPGIDKVIKIDPLALAVHQLFVITDHADGYGAVCKDYWWRKHCLPAPVAQRSFPVRHEGSELVVDVPHCEFETYPAGGVGFGVREFNKWVTVVDADGRLVLWAGYHRTFARTSQMDPAPEFTVERAVPVVRISMSAADPNRDRLIVATGLRPPLFRDFFDEALFFTAQFRQSVWQFRATVNGNQITVSKRPVQRYL